MKNFFSCLFAVVAMVLCVICIFIKTNDVTTMSVEDVYSLTTVVIAVDYDNDCVYCQDFNGEVWCFSGCEDWAINDVCSMVMYDNHTPIISDDEIVSMKYCGWFDRWQG